MTMHWTCPHCSTKQAIPTQQFVKTNHTLRRCGSCRGYSFLQAPPVKPKIPARPKSFETPLPSLEAPPPQKRQIAVRRRAALPPPLPEIRRQPEPKRNIGEGLTQLSVFVLMIGTLVAGVSSLWDRHKDSTQIASLSNPVPKIRLQKFPVEYRDQIRSAANAPSRPDEAEPIDVDNPKAQGIKEVIAQHTKIEKPTMFVRARTALARFRSGPGKKHKPVGKADPKILYIVRDWKNRWYRVVPKNQDSKTALWIRNDLVTVVFEQ